MATTDVVAPAPAVRPFQKITSIRCERCGESPTGWQRFLARLRAGSFASSVSVRSCDGGKELVDRREDPIAMLTGRTEQMNPCAGILEPHLHVSCDVCKHQWLMEPRNASKSNGRADD